MEPETLESKSIMIVAGEASGDMHGAALVRAMQEKDSSLRFFGTGGKELAAADVEILCDIDKITVMGLSEIFATLKDILATYQFLKRVLREKKPSLLILIDFGEFNLRLAKHAKRLNIPIFYYIPPKVWVWRKGRVRKLAKYVDCAAVILPFEEPYLQERGVHAKYVGNPVVDEVVPKLDRNEFCQKYSLDTNKAIVGILPGSRKKEVFFLLPIFLESARRMQKKYSRELTFVLPLASTLTVDDLNRSGLEKYTSELDIHVISDDRYELMAACDGVVAASGTVTLELAVLDVPMVVAYKFTPISYYIGKMLIHIPFFSLVNIIAGKNVVTELLQDQVHPAAVELELARILFDDGVRVSMKKELSNVRNIIGGSGASQKAAKLAFDTMV
jgi:lipid-A-disaccharide synthase